MDPTGGDTDGGELSLCAGAAGMSDSVGGGGSDRSAAGAAMGPELSSGVHATSWNDGALEPAVASAGAEA